MIEWLRIAMKSILYFPLQSFLQSLVHLLEDAHEQVRTSAKMLLAEAYHSSNRSIKETIERELRAQKTRETIVSAILDASQGTAVSLTSPTRVSKTPHLPVRDLDMEMDKFSESFKGKETEENWAQRDSSLKWIRSYFFTQDGQKGNFAKYAKPVADALAVSVMPSK